jgi:hypothetical protein
MGEKLYNVKSESLAKRRELLVAQAAAQRLLLTEYIETLRAPIALADRGLAAMCYIKRHPILTAVASLGMFKIVRSTRAIKWFQNGWMLWQVVRKLRSKPAI